MQNRSHSTALCGKARNGGEAVQKTLVSGKVLGGRLSHKHQAYWSIRTPPSNVGNSQDSELQRLVSKTLPRPVSVVVKPHAL